ncbi:AP-4 complex accessory subunit RUSC2-like [Heterodontus francisci]|uniref:AP-4 complex accessory subunit RUSC2-like n=1 Tax=Heterodontus francisci TaxID=7792 RepID=UPI00355B2325
MVKDTVEMTAFYPSHCCPCLKPLHSLFCQLDQLSQLRNSQKKFNAFIFGLLNLKLLDFWMSHLHGCREVLTTYYSPTAFLSLSHSSGYALFQELLLLLQPLSVFTFHLDPLFEYHYQFLADQGGLGSESGLRGLAQKEWHPAQLSGTQQGENSAVASSQPGEGKERLGAGNLQKLLSEGSSNPVEEVNHQGQAEVEEPSSQETTEGASVKRQQNALEDQRGKGESGYTLQQTFDQAMQWGDRLAQTLVELKKPSVLPQQEPLAAPTFSPQEQRTGEAAPGVKNNLSWWNQLSQSSQVYLAPSQGRSLFAKWMKPKAASSTINSPFKMSDQESSAPKQGSARGAMAQESSRQLNKSSESILQSSEDRGFGASCTDSTGPVAQKDSTGSVNNEQLCNRDPSDKPEEATPPTATPNRRPGWFKNELDCKALLPGSNRLWLGRLFGAKVPCTYSPGTDQTHQEAKDHRGRLPSDWLQVSTSHFDQLLKVIPVRKDRFPPLTEINTPSQEPTSSARMVRTLCDHTATDKDHLSFRKGDTLEILACVDEDWIHCCHGDTSGLVPIGYTSLI